MLLLSSGCVSVGEVAFWETPLYSCRATASGALVQSLLRSLSWRQDQQVVFPKHLILSRGKESRQKESILQIVWPA